MTYLGRLSSKRSHIVRTNRPGMKKLTVMVSLYNSGDWVENRLHNLCRSKGQGDIEIWCVNANSPDARDETIPARFPVRYVRLPERVGVYAAWNYIIKNSNSEFITNANADDLIAPDGYWRLICALERLGPLVGFAYPSWYITEHANLKWSEVITREKAKADGGGKPGEFTGDLNTGGVGHFPLWRRSLHNDLGYFDERFKALGDADWWSRCYHVGKTQFYWLKQFLGCYLWRNGENLWHQTISDQEWALYHQKVNLYKQSIL
jgi:glycosyltransferase involved in cell wall biosynthesis